MKKSVAITLVLMSGLSVSSCSRSPELMDDCPPKDTTNCKSNKAECLAAGGNCSVGGGYYRGSTYVPYYGGRNSFYSNSSGTSTTGAKPNGVASVFHPSNTTSTSSTTRGGFGSSSRSSGS